MKSTGRKNVVNSYDMFSGSEICSDAQRAATTATHGAGQPYHSDAGRRAAPRLDQGLHRAFKFGAFPHGGGGGLRAVMWI